MSRATAPPANPCSNDADDDDDGSYNKAAAADGVDEDTRK